MSVIANGAAEGRTLADWLAAEGQHALGRNAEKFPYFPLLIKLIDAHDDLSVQVHPADDYRCPLRGSTERQSSGISWMLHRERS